VSLAKSIYHRIIPEAVRNPIGRARRGAADRLTRALSPAPLPPPRLLLNVQMTPYVDEFIRIGRQSASTIRATLGALLDEESTPEVLDFGCGCGRTLLHLSAPWNVHGCDIDAQAIEWLQREIHADRFLTNEAEPPLPWPDARFDAVYAVSVFTHFSESQHGSWRRELARILRPGGLMAVSSMGPGILSNFPAHATDENRTLLRELGFFFVPASQSFNANAAFHSPSGLARLLSPEFELIATSERGLDGFQDLSVFRRAPLDR
jgi:SAM-dependent methyltransferase